MRCSVVWMQVRCGVSARCDVWNMKSGVVRVSDGR